MLKFGIIGCGEISAKHIAAIKEIGGELVAVCDNNTDGRALFLAKKLGLETAWVEWEAMINEVEMDVVAICTPNYLHVPMAYTALEKGLKVILEKPVATSSIQLVELEQHPRWKDVAVCYQRRFNKQCKAIAEYAKEHNPVYAYAKVLVKRDPEYWATWRADWTKSGGGNLMNIDIHYLDLLQWWIDGEIYVNSAGIFKEGNIDKAVFASLQFGSVPAHFIGSSVHTKRDIAMAVHFDDGKTLVYDTDDATHEDVYRGFLEKNDYVTVREAAVSLRMVEEIYGHASEN